VVRDADECSIGLVRELTRRLATMASMTLSCPQCGTPLPPDYVQKRRRQWRRFSVRTLLVAVTILSVWLGSQVRTVHNRRAVLRDVVAAGGRHGALESSAPDRYAVGKDYDRFRVSAIRRLFGDETYFEIVFDTEPSDELRARVEKTFPESYVLAPSPSVAGEHEVRSGPFRRH
jgi:hypothetical protein